MSDKDTCIILGCDNPADGFYMCAPCAHSTQKNLNDLKTWILDDLLIVITKQTKIADKHGSRSTNITPLPYNDQASKLNTQTINLMREIDKHINPNNQVEHPRKLAHHLEVNIKAIRLNATATTLAGELNDLTLQIKQTIDRPPTKWYAGKCLTPNNRDEECEAEIYASFATGIVTCPKCKTQHDIVQRRKYLIETAKTMNVTAIEAARAIQLWTDIEVGSTKKLHDRIRQWATRGRLMERGHILEQNNIRPIYQLGEILDLITEQLTKSQK